MSNGPAVGPARDNSFSWRMNPNTALQDCMLWIRQASLFGDLSGDECAEVASIAQTRSLERGQMLFREGEPLQHVSLLASGRLKVTQLGPSGQQVILRLKVAGDVVSERGLAAGSLHSSTAQALEPSRVLLWHRSSFESLCDRFPSIRRHIAHLLADRLQQLEERFRELATEQVEPRLARTLVRLLQRVGNSVQDGAVSIGLSREELAQLAGTTLFTVSRLLSDWDSKGVVRAVRGAVLIRDQRRLLEIAELTGA